MEWTREPALSELLRDPIVQALMVADRVEQHDLDVLFATVRRQLRRHRVLARLNRGMDQLLRIALMLLIR
jgi:hypothetical protein